MLSELLQEAGFIQKFDKIESQAKHMTMDQFVQMLKREHRIKVTMQVVPGLHPMSAGSAAIDQELDKDGYFEMFFEVGPGVDEHTNVYAIQGLIDNMRHEMQHKHHILDNEPDRADYIHPGMPQSPVLGRVLYTYQYMERPSQVLDLCTALAGLDSNPDEFTKAANLTKQIMDHELSDPDPDARHDIMALGDYAARSAMSEVMGGKKIQDTIDTAGHRHAQVVHHHVVTMAMGIAVGKAMSMDNAAEGKKTTNMIGSFNRQLRKKFPEARAYFRKHSDDRTKEFQTSQVRVKEILKAEDQFASALEQMMKSLKNKR